MNLRLLEGLGVALIVAAAMVPRLRDVGGPFDREFGGFQGAFFAMGCVNYERYGVDAFGGYPTCLVDLPDPSEEAYDPARLAYANHPPLVPLMLLAWLRVAGPEGWSDAWREHRHPDGIEPHMRTPILAFHLLGLLAFWWALRQGGGPRVAMLGLAILAMTPLSILYARLINYENTSLFFVCLAYGFQARRLRGMPGRNLLGCALSFAAAGAVTYAPVCFVPPLLFIELRRRGLRATVVSAAVLLGAVLAPLLVHAAWTRVALPGSSETLLTRVSTMLGPLLTGEQPFHLWVGKQVARIAWYASLPIALAAAAGLVLALPRGLIGRRGERRPRALPTEAPVELGPPLLLGGVLYMLVFYRHTFDGAGVRDGQTVFLMDVVPGVAACAATFLDRLAGPLERLRGGVAPLVVATSMIGVFGIARANELHRLWREPGPADVAGETARGPAVPLPSTTGAELHALLPAGSVTFYPSALGFNLATGYYAWRTMIAVERDSFGQRVGSVGLLGLGDRARFLLLPKAPSAAVRAQLGDLRDELAAVGPPFAEDERWEVWPLAEDG
jgi:hypothetical protein